MEVLVEFDVDVPLLFIPCQYQVTPVGAEPDRVNILSPHVLVATEKEGGWLGYGFIVTLIDSAELQQFEELSRVRT